ncbi:MAG: aspartyl protease family protein [Myxococcales bacterium]|nr:aspartyl protease family protein [Myxococcales bacterium]
MRTVSLLLAALALGGCRTPSGLSAGMLARLRQTPEGYLSGEVSELSESALMNNMDFVYSIAISRGGEKVAFTHLGPKTFQLGMWDVSHRPRQVADQPVNHYQYDVESLAFSPDGKAVATASRDGAVRIYSAETGSPTGACSTEEPLVSVAFHPTGRYLAVGSSRGLVTVLSFPSLEFSFELRAHEGEVRGLSFADDGTLYSGGWDKSIVAFASAEEEAPTDSARLRFERRGGYSVVRGTVNGRVSAAFAFDARVPFAVVTSEVARAAGIDVPFLKDTATVATPMGNTVVRVARGQALSFKALQVVGLDLAVCDACVPPDTQGVLGEAFIQRYEVAFDEVGGEALLSAKQKAEPPRTMRALALSPRKRMGFEWYVNDFSLDRSGRFLGVAFSEVKAERTREIYEREKKGVPEPLREGNAGAIVDAHTGLLVHKWTRHEGVVATAAISPDGQTLATGGWDKRVYLHHPLERSPIRREFGWSVRRVRFSEDGRYLAVAAWTPQNPLGDQQSNPSAMLYELLYHSPEVQGGPAALAR